MTDQDSGSSFPYRRGPVVPKLAPHVRTIKTPVDPETRNPKQAAPEPAPHVQVAISTGATAQPRDDAHRHTTPQLAPHVQAAIAAGAAVQRKLDLSRPAVAQPSQYPSPSSSFTELSFSGTGQKKANWCFAAVTASIHNYYFPNATITQEDVVKSCHGDLEDKPYATFDALYKLNLYAGVVSGLAKGDRILLELVKKHPIVISMGSHSYVLYGVSGSLESLKVHLFDPAEGGSTLAVSYKDLKELGVDRCYFTSRS